MAIYYPYPDDFKGFLESYFPANVTYSKACKCFAVKPLTPEFTFMIEMTGAPFVAEDDDPDEVHAKNGMDNFDKLCDAWEQFWCNKSAHLELMESFSSYNKREKAEFESKLLSYPGIKS